MATTGGKELARDRDAQDPLREYRQKFHIPLVKNVVRGSQSDAECTYLCGNSLGLQPRGTRDLVNQELQVWQESYVFVMETLS